MISKMCYCHSSYNSNYLGQGRGDNALLWNYILTKFKRKQAYIHGNLLLPVIAQNYVCLCGSEKLSNIKTGQTIKKLYVEFLPWSYKNSIMILKKINQFLGWHAFINDSSNGYVAKFDARNQRTFVEMLDAAVEKLDHITILLCRCGTSLGGFVLIYL